MSCVYHIANLWVSLHTLHLVLQKLWWQNWIFLMVRIHSLVVSNGSVMQSIQLECVQIVILLCHNVLRCFCKWSQNASKQKSYQILNSLANFCVTTTFARRKIALLSWQNQNNRIVSCKICHPNFSVHDSSLNFEKKNNRPN